MNKYVYKNNVLVTKIEIHILPPDHQFMLPMRQYPGGNIQIWVHLTYQLVIREGKACPINHIEDRILKRSVERIPMVQKDFFALVEDMIHAEFEGPDKIVTICYAENAKPE